MKTPIVVNRNERFWAIQMINQINSLASQNTGPIKSVGGEATINTHENVMFPDIVLYGDTNQTSILQGWEIKCPDVLITNRAFIDDAHRKADILGLNSCVIWNFTYCELHIKNNSGDFECAVKWDTTKHIKTREDIDIYRKDWEVLLEAVIVTINGYLDKGTIQQRRIDFAMSNTAMPRIIAENKNKVAETLKSASRSNTLIESNIEKWWNEVKVEYLSDEANMYSAYGKTILLNWLNKIVFANIIKYYHTPAAKVENITDAITPEEAVKIFSDITKKCDYYSIFEPFNYECILPLDTWKQITSFSQFLGHSGITHIAQESLQSILENTVTGAKRELIGQYPTPPKLAELLTKITVTDVTKPCIDPCCGTGTIPKAIIDYKQSFDIPAREAHESTWASDNNAFPLQVASICLTSSESINVPSRVIKENVFDLKIGKKVDIVDPVDGTILKLALPKFGAIISNLPFVDFNTAHGQYDEIFTSLAEGIESNTEIRLSGRSDMYIYIIFYLWSLLEDNGKLGVVTSNSWLGTKAGECFIDALRCYYAIEGIYSSGNGRWFSNAQVVTTLLVLKKKKDIKKENDIVRFGIIQKSLKDLEESVAMQETKNAILLGSKAEEYVKQRSYSFDEIDIARKLGASVNSLFHNISWLTKIQSKLCPLKSVFTTFRGERTGQDDIFYVNDPGVVDSAYVVEGLKTGRNVTTLIAQPDSYAIVCSKSYDELNQLGHSKTVDWFKHFEQNLNVSVKCKGNTWYQLKTSKYPYLFTGMNPDKRIYCGKFEKPTFINQRLIGLLANDNNVDIELSHALLNSIFFIFSIEASGFPMGLGALDINEKKVSGISMLNPKMLNKQQRDRIVTAFKPLLQRKIKTVAEEFTMPDRMTFDHTVLSVYGIDDYYEQIKASIISMQSVRSTVKKPKI